MAILQGHGQSQVVHGPVYVEMRHRAVLGLACLLAGSSSSSPSSSGLYSSLAKRTSARHRST